MAEFLGVLAVIALLVVIAVALIGYALFQMIPRKGAWKR